MRAVREWRRADRATFAAWAVLVALVLWRVADLITFDFRKYPLSGDQASFVMQAQSLAHGGHNLSFDVADFERWVALGWADQPYGLFFRQTDSGWIFGKPYSYSLYLAPFMRLFGDVTGIAVANAALLVALTVVIVMILRTRYSGTAVPLATVAFVFGSASQYYAWVAHTELLLALGVGVATYSIVRCHDGNGRRIGHLVLLAATVAWLFSEKATMGFVFLPIVLVMFRRATSTRERIWFLGVGAVSVALFVSPYLWYSQGQSWNPYQGERYRATVGVPFDGSPDLLSGAWKSASKEDFFSSKVLEVVTKSPAEIPRSVVTSTVGRHTGLLAFAPMSFFVLVLAIRRFRSSRPEARAVWIGIAGYLLLYALLIPRFYTGGHSLGNRYFVQISTFVVGLLVLRGPSKKTVDRLALVAIAASVTLIGPHLMSPRNAYSQRLGVTTPIQRLLPAETQLRNWRLYACPFPYEPECISPPAPTREDSGASPRLVADRVPARDDR